MTEFESWWTFSFFFFFQTLAGEGRVYKCLFNHKFEDSMSERVSAIYCVHILFIEIFFSSTKYLKWTFSISWWWGKSLIVMMVTEQWSVQIVMDTAFLQIKNQTRWAFSCVISVCVCCVSSVPRGADHQTETDCSGLQGQLLAGQSLQVGPEEVPLQRGHQHAPSEGSSPVLPSAVSGVSRPSRWADLYLSLLAPATN